MSCDTYYYSLNVTVSDAFTGYNVAIFCVGMIVLILTVLLRIIHRKHERIDKSNPGMLMVAAFGTLWYLIIGPLFRVVNGPFECAPGTIAIQMAFPLLLWPLIARIIVWRNRISLNFKVAATASMYGVYDQKVNRKSQPSYFYASNVFAGLLTVIPILIVLVLILGFTLAGDTCGPSVCGGRTPEPTISLIITVFFSVLAPLFTIFYYRDVPDSLGIRKESLRAFVGLIICILLFTATAYTNLGNVEDDTNLRWNWVVFVDIGILGAAFLVLTFPLYVILCESEEDNSGDTHDLEDLLKNKRGYQYFQMHVATELSLENLLFYKAVEDWKKKYDDSDKSQRTAFRVRELFFAGGTLEINISNDSKEGVLEAIPSEFSHPPIDVFDKALDEVKTLLATHSYPRFKSSDFYKLYTGELTLTKATQIKTTGLSSFTVLGGAEFNLEDLSTGTGSGTTNEAAGSNI